MKFKRFISAALSALFVINAAVFAAEDTQEETIKFIVELKESPVIDEIQNGEIKVFGLDDAAEKKAEKLLRTQSMVQNEIEEDIDENVIKGFNYTHVLNGFSMEGTAEDMAKIAVLPDVKAVCPVQTYEAPPKVENADITNCCSEMNIEYLRNNGISGQGQVIAVIDSGFDVQHEMFSGDIEDAVLSKNDIANIIADTELSCEKGKNITANRVYVSEKIPFAFNYTNKSADVYTGDDHGTHVAGITAGNNGKDVDGTRLTGAAPDAQLLLMSVQPENEHHMDSEAILAAFDDVAKLGANVVNCSFGAPFNTEGKLESKAVERLRKAGIGVFFSAGNIGRGICEDSDEIENYYYGISAENIDYGSIGTPSHPSATTVASSEAEMYRKTYKLMYVDGNEIAFSDANKNYLFADRFCDAEYEFVYCGLGTAEDTENIDANGKIALIDRGAYFTETVPNLTEKGAVGVIVINKEDSIQLEVAPEAFKKMPFACVSKNDRDKLVNAQSKFIKADKEEKYSMLPNPDKYISLFSCWGNMRNMELKPEITAPGGRIYSSVPDDKYENMDGTSMAAPHVTGAAALIRQVLLNNKDKYGITDDTNIAEYIEKLLMSTASIIYRDSTPVSPRQQGAGMINLEGAAKTDVILSTDSELDSFKPKLSLGEISESFTLAFNAQNLSTEPVEYDDCSLVVITDDADENGKITDMRNLSFTSDMPQSITVNGNSKQKTSVNVTLDKNELDENLKVFKNGFYIDGFVVLSSSNADIPELSLPFTGFYGGWDNQSPLDKGCFDHPLFKGNRLTTYFSEGENEDIEAVLGENLFWSEQIYGDTYDEYNSQEFAGISPNDDDNYDILGFDFMPARKIGSYGVILYDCGNGESVELPISKEENFYWPKCMNLGYDLDLLKCTEGEYTLAITATNYGSDKKFVSEPLTFYVDNQKPEITKCELCEEDGKTLLKLAAKDDRHLMGFTVQEESEENKEGKENEEPEENEEEEDDDNDLSFAVNGAAEAETTFDVTGMKLDSLKIAVYDYAYNCEEYSFTMYLYGDVDCDNAVTASDAAFLTQKTLTSTFEMPIENETDEWLKYSDVDCDNAITASDAAMVLQKTLVSAFEMPAEKDSTKGTA